MKATIFPQRESMCHLNNQSFFLGVSTLEAIRLTLVCNCENDLVQSRIQQLVKHLTGAFCKKVNSQYKNELAQ